MKNPDSSNNVRQIANHRSIRRYAATVPHSSGFDYDAVERAIDGEPEEAPPPAAEPKKNDLAEFAKDPHLLREAFDWVGYGDAARFNLKGSSVFCRLLVLMWVFNIREFKGQSLAELASRHGQCTRALLDKHLRSFNRRFGVLVSDQRRKAHKPKNTKRVPVRAKSGVPISARYSHKQSARANSSSLHASQLAFEFAGRN